MTATDTTSLDDPPRRKRASRRGDLAFTGLARLAGLLVVALIGAIGLFLILKAIPAFQKEGWGFFTHKDWFPDSPPFSFGIAALAFGSVVASLVALVIAVPVALGSALFLTELAPPRLGRWIGYLLDLLAAVPSVVYGLWGLYFLIPKLNPVEHRVDNWFGFIPLLHSRTGHYGQSIFAASVVLAIMVLPIIGAISREIFRQVPRADREAALALGATRWEMIRLSVLPYSRSGIVGAVMLGLGRALGETIAVALILGGTYNINPHIFEPGGNTIAANIAIKFGEAASTGRAALIASGLVLFAITLIVNVAARGVVYRAGLATEGDL